MGQLARCAGMFAQSNLGLEVCFPVPDVAALNGGVVPARMRGGPTGLPAFGNSTSVLPFSGCQIGRRDECAEAVGQRETGLEPKGGQNDLKVAGFTRFKYPTWYFHLPIDPHNRAT